jgi:hypothetical protein
VSPAYSIEQLLDNGVQIFCECHDFKFRAAYSLAQSGNVFLNKVTTAYLGKALDIAPTKVTTINVCKHLYAVMIHFKNNLKSYNLVVGK